MTLFKHEFIMSIWLSERGFDTFLRKPSEDVYILELLTRVKMCLKSYRLQKTTVSVQS